MIQADQPEIFGEAVDVRGVARADEDQCGIGMALRDLLEGLREHGLALAGLDGSHHQHDPAEAGQTQLLAGASRGRWAAQ